MASKDEKREVGDSTIIELDNFPYPTVIRIRKENGKEVTEYKEIPLSVLEWKTLDGLCRRFRAGVFKNAKMEDSNGK